VSGLVLALDASTLRCAAALVGEDGSALGCWTQEAGVMGTAALAPAVEALLADAGVTPGDLAGVAVGTGPGSYTGLRSAIAFARALSHATGRPLVGMPSMASAAAAHLAAHADVQRVVLLQDARRGQSARAEYVRDGDGIREEQAPTLVASEVARSEPTPGVALLEEPEPSAVELARLARPHLLAGGDDPRTVLPLYLKPSHAELALRERENTRGS
jgi:tRNA threonylcarbamoyl adenosine modification protein YeaZ